MSAPVARRGFLRDLVGLPLLGGSLTLIGAPRAVAAPVTVPLLKAYEHWLAVEYGETLIELEPLTHPQRAMLPQCMQQMAAWRREWCQDNTTLTGGDRTMFAAPPAALPSTRAALILSAVGCGWEGRQW